VSQTKDNIDGADIVIARICKARGIRGEVACEIETDFPDRFDELDTVTVWMPDNRRLDLKVEDHWFHKDRVILKFEGCDTMDDALRLVGGRLVISESDARQLDDDEFYEYELVGSDAVTTDGKLLGRVSSIMRTGGTDVLVVKASDGRELMIPFADEICTDVDTRARRITVDAPEGLLE
jgi:16S rRNA processing protein RimM